MKDSNTLAGNATIKRHPKEILLNTKGQYKKVSNTHAKQKKLVLKRVVKA